LTQLILVRHGQTAWNKQPRFRSQADIELDETGIAQAQATANRLYDFSIAAVYSSPLKRAMATAQPIADKFGLSVEPHNGLIDINFGKCQGLTPDEARVQYDYLVDSWLSEPHTITFPEGECLNDVRDRFKPTLNKLITEHGGQTIVLVSHMVALKTVLCSVLGLDNSHFWQIAQDTCAINIVTAKNSKYIISLLNDTCHLNK
jgi:broad specificity phosphatase PhoE